MPKHRLSEQAIRSLTGGLLLIVLVGCHNIGQELEATLTPTLLPIPETPVHPATSPLTPTPVSGLRVKPSMNPLDTESCNPPCWQGLVPGETTESEVRHFLANHPGITGCHDFDDGDESGIRGIGCYVISFTFGSQGDTLDSIGYRPDKRIILDQLIKRYGSDSHVYIDAMYHTDIVIIYPEHGLVAYITLPDEITFVIQPDFVIDEIGYLAPQSIYDEQLLEGTVPWQGYVDYSGYFE